ncbi:MAG: hypothetical protein ABFR90_08630 [Planctomycetota bacterium]
MVVIAEMNVLAVGIEDRSDEFKGLPVRLINLARGTDAVHSFKTGQIDSVISHWHLTDMPDGRFLKKLKTVKPDMPTIAIIEANNHQQEIEARMLGVSAVIPDDCDDEYFRDVITSVLGLSGAQLIGKLYAVAEP